MTVAEAVGGNYKDKLLRCPLGRSGGGDDNNSSGVPFRSLWRDPNDGGTPFPRRSYDNKTHLYWQLLVLTY